VFGGCYQLNAENHAPRGGYQALLKWNGALRVGVAGLCRTRRCVLQSLASIRWHLSKPSVLAARREAETPRLVLLGDVKNPSTGDDNSESKTPIKQEWTVVGSLRQTGRNRTAAQAPRRLSRI
jgi:hypothetical protein